jgi:hypothetical protein
MEDTVCPRCDTELEPVDSVKSHRRDTIYYIIGIIALAITAFFERDLSNYDDMVQGGVVFGALIIGSFFWFYIRGRSGIGYPIR